MGVEPIKGSRFTYDTARSDKDLHLEEVIDKAISITRHNLGAMTRLSMKAKKGKKDVIGARTFKINYASEFPTSVVLHTAITAADTTTFVFKGNYIVDGMKLLALLPGGDREVVMTGIASSDSAYTYTSGTDTVSITNVTRGHCGTTAAAEIPQNTVFRILGHTAADNSTTPDSQTIRPAQWTQNIEVQRTAFSISSFSDTWEKKFMLDQEAFDEARLLWRSKAWWEHKVLYGEGDDDQLSTVGADSQQKERYHMYGLIPFHRANAPTANKFDCNGTVTPEKLEAMFEPFTGLEYENLWCICPQSVITMMSKASEGRVEYERSEDTYGMRVHRFQAPNVPDKVNFVHCSLLDPSKSTEYGVTDSNHGGSIIILDPSTLGWKDGQVTVTHGTSKLRITGSAVLPVPYAENKMGISHERFVVGAPVWRDVRRVVVGTRINDYMV